MSESNASASTPENINGYIVATGEQCEPAFTGTWDNGTDTISEFSLTIATSSAEFHQAISIDASASYKGGVTDVSGTASFMERVNYQENNCLLIITAQQYKTFALQNLTLIHGVTPPTAGDAKSQTEFFNSYGDSIPFTRKIGGRYIAVLKIETQTSSEQTDVAAQFKAKSGAISGDMKAGFEQSVADSSYSMSTYDYVEGYSPLKLGTSIDDIFANGEALLTSAGLDATLLTTLQPYSSDIGVPFDKIEPNQEFFSTETFPLTINNQNKQYTLREWEVVLHELQARMNSIQQLLTCYGNLSISTKITDAQTATSTAIKSIKGLRDKYGASPATALAFPTDIDAAVESGYPTLKIASNTSNSIGGVGNRAQFDFTPTASLAQFFGASKSVSNIEVWPDGNVVNEIEVTWIDNKGNLTNQSAGAPSGNSQNLPVDWQTQPITSIILYSNGATSPMLTGIQISTQPALTFPSPAPAIGVPSGNLLPENAVFLGFFGYTGELGAGSPMIFISQLGIKYATFTLNWNFSGVANGGGAWNVS